MTELWDPERLATVGWIMNRYSDFLSPGDRIRIGQEGDPCNTYRSSEDAPSARVENVEREVDGTVRFRAVMESSGATINLDNRNVASDRVWEIHPSQVEEFRKRVQGERLHRGATDEPEESDGDEEERPTTDETEPFHPSDALESRVKDMEFRGTAMEQTIGGAIRELAGDLMRIYRGEEPTFSIKFADKYDLALTMDTYKGSREEKRSSSRDARHEFEDYGNEASSPEKSTDRHNFEGEVTALASYTDDVRAVYPPDEL